MMEYKVLIRISAENEDDMRGQLEAIDGLVDSDIEWYCGVEE